MKNATKILFGVVAILAGVLYFGDALDLWSISLSFAGWWTLFLIVPAIGSMITSKINLGNSILLGLGLWLLVQQQNWFDNDNLRRASFAVILVVIGIVLILSEFRKKKHYTNSSDTDIVEHGTVYSNHASESSDDHPSYFTAFGSNTIKNVSKSFKGGDAVSIFGGMEIDLSNAIPSGNAKFNVTSIFGGVDIVAPKGFNIVTDGVSLLGGCDNQVKNEGNDDLPIFTIKYFTMFGGIDIV